MPSRAPRSRAKKVKNVNGLLITLRVTNSQRLLQRLQLQIGGCCDHRENPRFGLRHVVAQRSETAEKLVGDTSRMSAQSPYVMPVGDPRRPLIGRVAVGTLVASAVFFVFTVTKQIKPVYLHAPWVNDPSWSLPQRRGGSRTP